MIIKWTDVFDIIEMRDKRGQIYFRLQFKNDKTFLLTEGMSMHEGSMPRLAWRWIEKNRNKVQDIIFETEVLNE